MSFFKKLGSDIKHTFTDTHPKAYQNTANNLISSGMPQDVLLGGFSGVAKTDNSQFYNKSNNLILDGASALKIPGASDAKKFQGYREQVTQGLARQQVGQNGKGRNPNTQTPTQTQTQSNNTQTPQQKLPFDNSHIMNGLQASSQLPFDNSHIMNGLQASGQSPIYRPAVMPPENQNTNILPIVRPVLNQRKPVYFKMTS